jgi:hypothetical protein
MIVDYHLHLRGPVGEVWRRDFEASLERLRSAGCETVTVFDGRVGRQEPLG